MKKITSYLLCCAALGQAPLTIEDFKHLPEDEQRSAFGEHKIKTWAKAINGKDDNGQPWKPDWNDRSTLKWRAWWDMYDQKGDAPGSGFAFRDSDCGDDAAALGARLHFRTKEGLLHSVKHGLEDWRDMMKG